MALESWRFAKVIERLLATLDAGEQRRYSNQFRWFMKKVEEALTEANLHLVDLKNHPFDPGMAATPLNIDEFDENDTLVVDQVIEPTIMGSNGIVRTGTVILRKVSS